MFLLHDYLASADDVNACWQLATCVVVEAVSHAATLEVVYRTVLSVGRLVRRAADAGGLAVDDDGELLGATVAGFAVDKSTVGRN